MLEPKWDGWRSIAYATPDGPQICTRHGRFAPQATPALDAALAVVPAMCWQRVTGGRVRCRFDRLTVFMLAPVPHRPAADGLTVTMVAFARARRRGRARPTEVEQLPEVISVDEAPIHAAHAGQGGRASPQEMRRSARVAPAGARDVCAPSRYTSHEDTEG